MIYSNKANLQNVCAIQCRHFSGDKDEMSLRHSYTRRLNDLDINIDKHRNTGPSCVECHIAKVLQIAKVSATVLKRVNRRFKKRFSNSIFLGSAEGFDRSVGFFEAWGFSVR